MKPEEAIWHYNALKEHYLSSMSFLVRDRTDEISKEVIAMLEKQIPKKPERLNTFRSIGKCGGCERVISTRTASVYCQHCGNKVDWGNDDET